MAGMAGRLVGAAVLIRSLILMHFDKSEI